MSTRSSSLNTILFFGGLVHMAGLALAFTFTNTDPTECGDLSVSWEGGQPPFRLLIIPPGSSLINISIPSTAFQNNAGTFQTQLPIAWTKRFMLSISDTTGVTAGGISDLLTVGQAINGNKCNTTVPTPDFFFTLDDDLAECKNFLFSLYSLAIQPATIIGFIATGQSFSLNPPIGDSFTWKGNLTAGTTLAFAMHDSQGRDGGVADALVVKLSDDKSCFSTSASSITPSTTPTSSVVSPAPPTETPSSHHTSIGALVGGVVGGLVFITLLALLVILLLKRRRPGKSRNRISIYRSVSNPSSILSSPVLTGPHFAITPYPPSQSYPTPTTAAASIPTDIYTSMHPSFVHTQPSMEHLRASGYTDELPDNSYLSPMSSSAGNSATALQPRIRVHTDITEAGMVDLPPLYSPNRAPIAGLVPAANLDAAAAATGVTSPTRQPRKT